MLFLLRQKHKYLLTIFVDLVELIHEVGPFAEIRR